MQDTCSRYARNDESVKNCRRRPQAERFVFTSVDEEAEAELPGFKRDDLQIYVTGNQLAIKGELRPPEHEQGTWHRRERGYGSFTRG